MRREWKGRNEEDREEEKTVKNKILTEFLCQFFFCVWLTEASQNMLPLLCINTSFLCCKNRGQIINIRDGPMQNVLSPRQLFRDLFPPLLCQ